MESEIRSIAYRLWEEAGRPESDGVEFWLLAEKICTNPIVDSEIDVGYYFPQDNPKTIDILKKFGRKILDFNNENSDKKIVFYKIN